MLCILTLGDSNIIYLIEIKIYFKVKFEKKKILRKLCRSKYLFDTQLIVYFKRCKFFFSVQKKLFVKFQTFGNRHILLFCFSLIVFIYKIYKHLFQVQTVLVFFNNFSVIKKTNNNFCLLRQKTKTYVFIVDFRRNCCFGIFRCVIYLYWG